MMVPKLKADLGVIGSVLSWNETLIDQHDARAEQAFFDTADFPWVADVEASWREIRAELDALLELGRYIPPFQDVHALQRQITDDDHWRTYFLRVYGWDIRRTFEQCPRTWEVLSRIPNMTLAMFSVFEPGKIVPPHRGPNKGVLRYHLGLKVPTTDPEQIGIKIKDEVRGWEEGKSLIFDDCHTHSVWNKTDQTRVVLFVDFLRPLPRWLEMGNRAMLNLAKYGSPDVHELRRNATRYANAMPRRSSPRA